MERVIGEFKNDGLLHLQFWEDEYNHNISDFAVPEADAKRLYYELIDYFEQHVETVIPKKEEKAKEYVDKKVKDKNLYPNVGFCRRKQLTTFKSSELEASFKAGWDAGVEWQKEQMIDKACELVVNCVEDFMLSRMEIWHEDSKQATLNNIHKAMEEEK